jgi:hypothetical protein
LVVALQREVIGTLAHAGDSTEYAVALFNMGRRLKDMHAGAMSPPIATLRGAAWAEVKIEYVEGQPVVIGIGKDSALRASGLNVGDILPRVDGEELQLKAGAAVCGRSSQPGPAPGVQSRPVRSATRRARRRGRGRTAFSVVRRRRSSGTDHAERRPECSRVFRVPHEDFTKAVLLALPNFRFNPTRVDGHAVAQLVEYAHSARSASVGCTRSARTVGTTQASAQTPSITTA